MDENRKPVVIFGINSPYTVVGMPKLINSKGAELESKFMMTLCRCGASENKPFCDGSHKDVKFKGDKDKDRREDKILEFKGKEITIYDNRGVCSADGACVRESPKVFQKDKKPMWIFPDEEAAKKTIATIEKCPSGALSYSIGDGPRIQDLDREPAIKIAKDGPLEFVGHIEIYDEAGSKPESKEHYTLCRCGASKNKPFCDNTHKKYGFKDSKN